MRKHMRTFLSFLLTVCIIFSHLPVVTNAEESVVNVENLKSSKTENENTTDTAPTEAEIVYELTEKRDETTKYFAMSDGTTKACLYPQNIHYLDGDEYKEIDNTLVKDSKGENTYYKNKMNSFSVKIPENYADDYIEFFDENGYVKFKLQGATNKKIKKTEKEQTKQKKDKTLVENVNDKAIFKSVKADVDIEYDVTGNKLKETIVLYKKMKNAFVFDVKTSADRAVLNNDNSVSFLDADGKELYTMERPYMVDASGEYSNEVKTTLLGVGDSYTITYKPDYEWMSAKERVYPVKIDPTLFQAIYKETVADTYVTNAQTASDTRGYWDVMNIGKRNTTTGGNQIVLRGLIKFDIPSEIGSNDCIIDAKLDLIYCNYTDYVSNNGIQIDVHELKESFSEGNAWWGNQPDYEPIITDYAIVNTGNFFSGTSLSYDSFNLTKLVNKWHNGEANHGIMLKLHDDSSSVSTQQQVYYFAKQSTYYGAVSKFVEITYRNAVGLEDYWSYTTQDFGQYGTGYVNNYNGNLVYVHEDTSFNSLITGFDLSHIYNLSFVNNGVFTYGYGWKLNLDQTLKPTTVEGNSTVKYEYSDADGTKHFFVETTDGAIVDEDGLGLTFRTLSEGQMQRGFATKDGTIYKFDSDYKLREIVDTNGNSIHVNYTISDKGNKLLTSVTTSSGGYITLTYNTSDMLDSIYDNKGRRIRYEYAGGNLQKIIYPDNTILEFNYCSETITSGSTHWLHGAVAPDGTRLKYGNYHNGRVYVSRYDGENMEGNATIYTYLNHQTELTDIDDRKVIYQFDSFGRVTGICDSENNIYNYRYTQPNETKKIQNNKTELSSNGTVYVNNLLINGVFASGFNGWEQKNNHAAAEYSIVTDQGLITQKSVKIVSASEVSEVITQYPDIREAATYTLSGYLKYDNVESVHNGAGIEIVVYNGKTYRYAYSDFLTGTSDPDINSGFEHFSTTVTLSAGERIQKVTAGLYNASGTVWIDCLQLETGNTPNNVNLLTNSGFEKNSGNNTVPTGYVSTALNEDEGCVTSDKIEGSYAFKLVGNNTAYKSLGQNLSISGKAGDVYSFGGWGKANSVPLEDKTGNFLVALAITYTDGTTEWSNAQFNTFVTDWQFAATTYVVKKDYVSLKVSLGYDRNCNIAFFDNVFLFKDVAQSYVFDDEGNMVLASDRANQKQRFEYNGGNLSSLVTPDGSGYEYLYDSKNNLVSARSAEGIFYENKYDNNGNAISSELGGHMYSQSLHSGETYYIRLKSSGKYLEVSGSAVAGANVVQSSFTGASTQKWTIEYSDDGYYYLHPFGAEGVSLDLANGAASTTYNIGVYTNNFGDAQKFKIFPQSDYTYRMETKCFGDRVVGVTDSLSSSNVSAVTEDSGSTEQNWYFEAVDRPPVSSVTDGAVYQMRFRHSGKYVDTANSNTDVGATFIQYTQYFGKNQRYVIRRYGNTEYYTISPSHTDGQYISVSTSLNSLGYMYPVLGNAEFDERKLFRFEYDSANGAFFILPKINETLCLAVPTNNVTDSVGVVFASKISDTYRMLVLEKFSETIESTATYQNNGNFPHTVTDSRGNTSIYEYDFARGLQTAVTDSSGNKTEYVYNSLNDRLERVKAGGREVKYEYYPVGALKKISAPNGTQYFFDYDGLGRQKSISVGSRLLSEYAYVDTNGKTDLLSRIDYGNGTYRTYSYDAYDRLAVENMNGVAARSYVYDKKGNLSSETDHLAGITTRYRYDFIGRPTGVSQNDGQKFFMSYDNFNRVCAAKWQLGNISLKIGYVYGEDENRIYGVDQNNTRHLTYVYDELGRLKTKTVGTTVPYATMYEYLAGEKAGNTTELVSRLTQGSDTLEYAYDSRGNICNIIMNGAQTESYTYDALNQLTGVTYANGNVYTYVYDESGNILSVSKNGAVIKTYSYNDAEWKDLLTSYGNTTISYDNIGNPQNWRDAMSFTWSQGRKLMEISKGENTIAYSYNAEGERISKTVNGVNTQYYRTNGMMRAQKTGNEYILFLYDENGTTYGMVITNGTVSNTYYYKFNLQGDVVGIVDSTGIVVVEYSYDAWGKLLAYTGDTSLANKNPIRYRGYYYDAETGFYYVSSRYYDPEIGRFISADGYVSTGQDINGFNMFSYCGNNPVNRIDPTGTFWKEIGTFLTNTWKSVKKWAKNTFGSSASLVSTATYTETIIPEPSPIVVETGTSTKQTISQCGDSTKPLSVYADGSLTNPIKSSKVGVKMNIAKIEIDASFGKEATGITYSYTNNGATKRFGIIYNQSKLKYGIEFGTAIQWDNFEQSNFTNISVSGIGLVAAYVFAVSGQTILQPAYQY